jgi:hypothetical protein
MTNIYRALNQQKWKSGLYMPYTTMRVPGNVPYIVDNLWEWTRPNNYPSRRFSAFASPKPEIAIKLVGEGVTAYKVELPKPYLVCQLKVNKNYNVIDSRYYPECKSLGGLVISLLGKSFHQLDIVNKKEIGLLWMPCLNKEEIELVFDESSMLRKIKDQLKSSVAYWDNVQLCSPEEINGEGEIFFEYPNGYYLKSIL